MQEREPGSPGGVRSPPSAAVPAQILALQRSAGNQATTALLARFPSIPMTGPLVDFVRNAVRSAEVRIWAATKTTAAGIRAARAEVDALEEGEQLQLPGGPVTIDATSRRELRDALRHRLMERIAEVRAPLNAELATTHDAAARRAVQDRQRAAAAEFVAELRDPSQAPVRYDHPVEIVRNEVRAAIQLAAVGNAEQELADQQAHGAAGPQARARQVAHLPSGAWCGAFAYAQQHGAGLSPEARASMHSTGPHQGVDAFLEYENRRRVVWSGEEWLPVHAYHAMRGSERMLRRLPPTHTPITPGSLAAPTGLDIQPGDIVLIDNVKGTFADHITMCRSYDPSTGMLETIAGNEGPRPGRVQASAAPRDLNQNPDQRTVAPGAHKPARVYAYGRFSLVDYEVHTYLPSMPQDARESPDAMAARRGAPRATTH